MKARKRITLLFAVALCIFALFIPVFLAQASADTTPHPVTGVWQIIIDGAPGEGAFFYRLTFEDNGAAIVTKQFGGHNLSENKTWTMNGNKIDIKSAPNAEITDFDGATLNFISDKAIMYQKDATLGTINRHNSSIAFIHWLMVLILLMSLNELFRRSKWAGIVFYFIMPILMLSLWRSNGVTYWFKWVKLYSVVGASAWFILIRFTKLGQYKFARFIAALFLALNIGEAVTQDFSMGYLPNILNAIAGMLSIATLFYGWKDIHPDSSKEKDMIWPKMTTFWIVAYDIWNWVFVYLNFPGSASAQFMVLLSCTLPSLFIKKGTWLQARAFTLAAWFMYYFTFPRFTESVELLVPRNDSLMLLAALTSILANVIYAFIYVKMLSSEKKSTLTV